MKTFISFATMVVFSGSMVLPAAALEEIAVWKAEKVQSGDGAMTWTDEKQSYDLELADAEGVSIGEKPGVGGDEKSVVFSGAQQKAFVSTSKLPDCNGNLEVRLALNPGNSTSGTIIRCDRQWQVGIKQVGAEVFAELLLWMDSGGIFPVRVKIQPDAWQEITASISGNTATISCNGAEETKTMQESLRRIADGSTVYIGLPVTTVSATNKELALPFQGAVADIHVSM